MDTDLFERIYNGSYINIRRNMKPIITGFIEAGDFNMKVLFNYDGHDIETTSIPRTSTADEVKEAVRLGLDNWNAKRAVDNFENLQSLIGEEVEV